MPRKIDTHPNEQSAALPTDVVDAYKMPSDIETMLPSDLTTEKYATALEDIRYALGEYAWEYGVGPYRYTRAKASKALRDLLKTGEFDHHTLTTLNQRAYNLLFDCIDDTAVQQWMLLGGDARPPLAALELAAQRAILLNDSQKGPESSIPLEILVARLCHVYEAATGKSVTHHTKSRDLAYTQTAQSNAG
ncbi:hypothetical protein MWU60_19290 [Yoonia sp. F2084L]|uniref:hypothetical protein n=1 Tax=Yoonia sp. F2084L TaxID=2926419 RepID=UPI001FF66FAE|nr:hypothetical protein [Yoonia sp. F2084L]MCK0097726.1 hypothetical protein [Yoonia sp. F2084L]